MTEPEAAGAAFFDFATDFAFAHARNVPFSSTPASGFFLESAVFADDGRCPADGVWGAPVFCAVAGVFAAAVFAEAVVAFAEAAETDFFAVSATGAVFAAVVTEVLAAVAVFVETGLAIVAAEGFCAAVFAGADAFATVAVFATDAVADFAEAGAFAMAVADFEAAADFDADNVTEDFFSVEADTPLFVPPINNSIQ